MNELPVGGSELKPSRFLMLVDPRRRRRMRRVVLVARALGFWGLVKKMRGECEKRVCKMIKGGGVGFI